MMQAAGHYATGPSITITPMSELESDEAETGNGSIGKPKFYVKISPIEGRQSSKLKLFFHSLKYRAQLSARSWGHDLFESVHCYYHLRQPDGLRIKFEQFWVLINGLTWTFEVRIIKSFVY